MGEFIRSLSVDEMMALIMVLPTAILIAGVAVEVRKAARFRSK